MKADCRGDLSAGRAGARMPGMQTLHAERLWTPDGWRIDAGFTHDGGRIVECEHAQPSESSAWVLPGIANLHSHAFQRAMAGLAERQTNPEDSFWTWRDTMYRFAARFDPDTLHAVARSCTPRCSKPATRPSAIPLPAPRADGRRTPIPRRCRVR
jgi:hypothetical protein